MISFDVFAASPQGFEVHFQIQGDKVYDDSIRLLDKLAQDGFSIRGRASVNGHTSANGLAEHYCQEHETQYGRYEKDGRVWYSHKGPDGKWCKEK